MRVVQLDLRVIIIIKHTTLELLFELESLFWATITICISLGMHAQT